MSIRRMLAIVRKELLHIVRDPRNLFLVTISPAFLLFLLSYIFSFEVSRIRMAVLDLDHTPASRHYLANLTSDHELELTYTVNRQADILPLLKGGRADVGLVIPPGFGDLVESRQPALVQAIVDGTDPFYGRQAVGSLEARSAVFLVDPGNATSPQSAVPIDVRSQAWYNAGLKSLFSMVPGLLAIVLIMPTLAFALALTREKETGTLEGLMATPLLGREYLLGKLVAYIFTALLSALLAWLVAVLWFKVPFRGSLAVFLLLAAVYFLACMGATVVVAHFVKSQQTAMFIVLLIFIVPSFFLAGLISPVGTESVRSMLTFYAMPATHFVTISRALFLKGLGLSALRQPVLILLGMGLGALAMGFVLFRKKVA